MEATQLLHARNAHGIYVPRNIMENTGAMGTVHGKKEDVPTNIKVELSHVDNFGYRRPQ